MIKQACCAIGAAVALVSAIFGVGLGLLGLKAAHYWWLAPDFIMCTGIWSSRGDTPLPEQILLGFWWLLVDVIATIVVVCVGVGFFLAWRALYRKCRAFWT